MAENPRPGKKEKDKVVVEKISGDLVYTFE